MEVVKASTVLATTYTWVTSEINVDRLDILTMAFGLDWTNNAHTISFKVQTEVNGVWYDVWKDVSGNASLNEVTTCSIDGDTDDFSLQFDVSAHKNVKIFAKASNITGTATKLSSTVLNDLYSSYRSI